MPDGVAGVPGHGVNLGGELGDGGLAIAANRARADLDERTAPMAGLVTTSEDNAGKRTASWATPAAPTLEGVFVDGPVRPAVPDSARGAATGTVANMSRRSARAHAVVTPPG